MKSPFPSILPADLHTEGPDGNSTANEMTNSSGDGESYSARYQAFLYQQSQRNQRTNYQGGMDILTGLIRGLVNLGLFVAFFLGFLTLFGFGLSRLNGNFNVAQKNVSAAGKQAGVSETKPSPSPTPLKKSLNNK
jgi:hypothetical protein